MGSGLMLKLDFEKAYDNVNWESLMQVLRNRGFGPKWMGCINFWLSSAKTSVLVNDEPGREITGCGGLRQGDPLSPPLLFTLVAEGLNFIIRKAVDNGLIKGVTGSRNHSFINLQYVDDTSSILLDCGLGSRLTSINANCSSTGEKKFTQLCSRRSWAILWAPYCSSTSGFKYFGVLIRAVS